MPQHFKQQAGRLHRIPALSFRVARKREHLLERILHREVLMGVNHTPGLGVHGFEELQRCFSPIKPEPPVMSTFMVNFYSWALL